MGQYQAEILLAVHERALGLVDEQHVTKAEQLPCRPPQTLIEVVRSLPRRLGRVGERGATEEQVTLLETVNIHRGEWTRYLRSESEASLAHLVVAIRFECAYGRSDLSEIVNPASSFSSTGAIRFEKSTCNGIDGPALESLVLEQPRFFEVHYYLALLDLQNEMPDRAAQRLRTSLSHREKWPAALFALGLASMSLELYPDAVSSFQRTRDLLPEDLTTMLQEVVALSYAGRYRDGLLAAERLVGRNQWYLGDGLYWKAWNEARLNDLESAWASVRLAQKQLTNADVAKLAGLIALRRNDLETAAFEFGVARGRNPADCDSHDGLGLAQLASKQWASANATLRDVLSCLQREDAELEKAASDLEQKGRAAAAASRRLRVGENRKTRIKTWYNSAVASYNLGRKDEAAQWARMVPAASDFSQQAVDLLKLLGRRQ